MRNSITSLCLLLTTSASTFAGFGPNANEDLYAVGSSPSSVCSNDFDGDGIQDLAVSNQFSDDVTVFRGDGSGGLLSPVQYAVGSGPISIEGCDIDADGDIDLIILNQLSESVTLLINDGSGQFNESKEIGFGGEPGSIACSDFDHNSLIDLAVSLPTSNRVILVMNLGEGMFSLSDSLVAGSLPTKLLSADFTGDGWIDLVAVNPAVDSVTILINDGGGSFDAPVQIEVGDQPFGVASDDFDLDGDIDLAVTNILSHSISILSNDGAGQFLLTSEEVVIRYCDDWCPIPDTLKAPYGIATGFIDEDDYPDLLISFKEDDWVVPLINGEDGITNDGGAFGVILQCTLIWGMWWCNMDSFHHSIGSAPTAVLAVDFDQDGDDEAVVLFDSMDSVAIVENLTFLQNCCGTYTEGHSGNINYDESGLRNLADITLLIDRVYISKKHLRCEENGNVNGDVEGNLNLGDITRLIDHIYVSKEETAACQ